MPESSVKPAPVAPLTGPNAIVVRASSSGGPFASGQGEISFPLTRVSVQNSGKERVTIESVILEPLRKSQTGERVEARISVDETARQTLEPGESRVVTISGSAPARPGLYASVLRITAQQDAPLVIPIEIRVAAHAAWGIGAMLFGLLLAGALNLVDNESGVKGELGLAQRARDAANDLLLPSPAPPSLSALIDDMNHNYDVAIEILQKPREPSFVDHRSKDSEEPLKTAGETTANLRKILMEKPRRTIEVSDLSNRWNELRENFDALSKGYLVAPPPGSSLAERLGAFDVWAAERLLRPAIAFYRNDLAQQIIQVRLLFAAGRDADATFEAAATHRSMQRAANSLIDLLRTVSFYVQLSANDITSARRTRELIETSALPPERRAAVLKILDDAGALLKGPFAWPMRRDVTKLIADALTETLRAGTDAALAAVEAARVQAAREYSLSGVQAVLDEGAKLKRGPDGKIADPKEKFAWSRRVLDAWRQRLAALPQPPPPAMTSELDAAADATDANDLEALRSHMGGLFQQWEAYSLARTKTAMTSSRLATLPADARRHRDRLGGGPAIDPSP